MDPDVDWPAEQRREIAGVHRPRGRVAEPARDQPARHEPDRGRRAPAESRGLRVSRPRRRGGRAGRSLAAGGRASPSTSPTDLPPVLVDEVFIGQVLANTLDNAVKYGGPDAPIRVAAAVTARRPRPGHGRGRRPGRARARRCPGCSRSSTGSRARVRDRGAGPASAWRSSAASSRRWAARSTARPSELGGLAIDFDLPSPRPAAADERRRVTRGHGSAPSILLVEDDEATRERDRDVPARPRPRGRRGRRRRRGDRGLGGAPART